MNILQINKFFYIRDGISRYFFNVSNLLKSFRHSIYFFSMNHHNNLPYSFSDYFISNIDFKKNNFIELTRNLIQIICSLESKNKIRQLVNKFNISVTHLHSIFHYISPSILIELKKNNIPIVMTIHDYHLLSTNYLLFHNRRNCEITKPDKYYKALYHKCSRQNTLTTTIFEVIEKYYYSIFCNEKRLIDLFIAPSHFVKNKFLEYNFPEEKLVVIPHFIDCTKIKPSYTSKDYILYFGRLSEEKGVHILLDAVKTIPQIKCLIIGEGPQEKILKNKAETEKIKNVTFFGELPDKQMQEYILNARFSVLPSIWYEGFGLVLLEAGAYGKPAVASNIGGIPEVIDDGKTGLLFEPGNIDDCRKKILTLWHDSEYIKKMGYFARKKIEKEYNHQLHYQRLMKIYEKAIMINKKSSYHNKNHYETDFV